MNGKKKRYIPPASSVFHPDPEQAEKLKVALREESDTVAPRRIAQIINPDEWGRA
jgi:hypothetical protein